MSNENEKDRKRPYKLKARARRQEEVHRRITLAAVRLHETVGPAKTTMNAIAELAGVQRATVYNHFPTEYELIDACSSHWFVENPPPDPSDWAGIEDPARRTEQALRDMYSYYESGREMLGKTLRDAAVVPAMEKIRQEKWVPMMEGIVGLLATGWSSSNETTLRASLRVVLDFFTWQTLSESGLSINEAARVAASWIGAPLQHSDSQPESDQ